MNTFVKEELQNLTQELVLALYKKEYSTMELKDFFLLVKKSPTIKAALQKQLDAKKEELNETYFVETMRFVSNEDEKLITNNIPNYKNEDIIYITNSSIMAGYKVTKGSYVLNNTVLAKLQSNICLSSIHS
jgi:hypothetical protein